MARSHAVNKTALSLILLLSSSMSFAMYHDVRCNNGIWQAHDAGTWHNVHPRDVDQFLQSMSASQRQGFLLSGCKMRATRCTNGDFIVKRFVPGVGGGPILGFFTAVVGTVTTAAATLATAAVVTATTLDPLAGVGAAVVTVHAGMAATVYATAAAAAAPTP